MKRAKILWADDEIDLLKPYILFLEKKGFDVVPVNNGRDAVDQCQKEHFDVIFLDEHMPGISGLETLEILHSSHPEIPVVMITKSEDEGIMEKAIGRKITDYLIKPVNPHQILMALKKILDQKTLVSATNIESYREEFNQLSERINNCKTANDWAEMYKSLTLWGIEFSLSASPMQEVLQMQHEEANSEFGKFIKHSYTDWFNSNSSTNAPILSHQLMTKFLLPLLDQKKKVFFILIDNFRYDQWLVIKDVITEHFTYKEDNYYSILPTATQYARNALFAGMLPRDIATQMPDLWVNDTDDKGKNEHEEELLQHFMKSSARNEQFTYHKINSNTEGERVLSNFRQLEQYDLNVLVFNFIDILSHMRSESKMIKELAPNESAYRSLTKSWFAHSPLAELLKTIAHHGHHVVLTSDHGTVRVKKPEKVIAEKQINSNLRYKVGRHLTYNNRRVLEIDQPQEVGLPSPNISSRYIFALRDEFFVYPNNFNQVAATYNDTFQHGGVSMEEMIVPLITLSPK